MNARGVPMTTITIEISDDLAAKIDLATLPILLRELVGHKAGQMQAIEESDPLPRPVRQRRLVALMSIEGFLWV
jgi:hypothetical protein